jgi:hypothetical protein
VVAELINARTELIGSLVASFYAHDDLLTKAAKGLEFYTKLNANILKVCAQCFRLSLKCVSRSLEIFLATFRNALDFVQKLLRQS